MNLIFMGPPGSGKGTQSSLLQTQFGYTHLSTGDMFRAALSESTDVGLKAKGYMDRGEYVPDEVVVDLIRERLSNLDLKKGFILDGFPRTLPQANALRTLMRDLGLEINVVFFFDVAEKDLVTRLSSRRTCRACNRVVSLAQVTSGQALRDCEKSKKPCDFYQRDDDNAAVVSKRIQIYNQQTTPVLDYYRDLGVLVKLNANQAPSEVTKALVQAISVSQHGSN